MYKGLCLNPALNQVLSQLGHTDLLCVCDAGLPIPPDANRIDLALVKGEPAFESVCKVIQSEMEVEKIILAQEMIVKNPAQHDMLRQLFENVPVEYISHETFKALSHQSRAFVRTGECTAYCNCLFVSGVTF